MSFTIGSLFDGSGGFPLAASMCGGIPVWASEIEPYPIAVTKSRFPGMKHLGSVTEINGGKIEPVDLITFGSPCQDLSIAGKRAGLKHEHNGDEETTRSGLFMEAVRIIKEMREATNGEYPRFALWENVPGAFSSNKGWDFHTVLAELIRIKEPNTVMPTVPTAGWSYADVFSGNGWSLAYRVLDAQYWGVPQRRRRIYLVADFRGQCAEKVLFEREGLRGYFEKGGSSWEGTATDAEGSVVSDDRAGNCLTQRDVQSRIIFSVDGPWPALYGGEGGEKGYVSVKAVLPFDTTQVTSPQNGCNPKWGDPCHPLAAQCHPPTVICKEQYLFENHSQDTRYKGPLDICPMLPAQLGTGGNNTPFVVEGSKLYRIARGQANAEIRVDKFPCLNCNHEQPIVCGTYQNTGIGWWNESPVGATVRTPCGGDSTMANVCVEKEKTRYIVRRLTPTECARMQGFPDKWGTLIKKDSFTEDEYEFWLNVRNTHAKINGKAVKNYTHAQMLSWYNKLHTDSSEYKMWGNGIALPCAVYVMQGVSDCYE